MTKALVMLRNLLSWSPAVEDLGQKEADLTGKEKEAWNIPKSKVYIIY